MLTEAAQRFQEQYEKYDVEFVITRYDYMDEQEQLAEKYGTKEAADIFFQVRIILRCTLRGAGWWNWMILSVRNSGRT